MKIIKKELSCIDKSNNIIFQNEHILEILSNKIGYNASFRLEEEIAGYFISSNGSNSILFEISKVKKYAFQRNILGYSSDNGIFPYCKTKEDAMKLFNAILTVVIGKENY